MLLNSDRGRGSNFFRCESAAFPNILIPKENTMANPFVHVELNTTDLPKAKAFYGNALSPAETKRIWIAVCSPANFAIGEG